MVMERRGQGAPAATLVLLIGLFMLAYVLLLPPAEREVLLGGEGGSSGGTTEGGSVLVSEKPGVVSSTGAVFDSVSLGEFELFSTTEKEILTSINFLNVRDSLFSSKMENVSFRIDNLDEIESIRLYFSVDSHKGNLIIRLNGQDIFAGEAEKEQLLKLPNQYLNEGFNSIEFYSESVGWGFWRSNYYMLKDVSIIKEVKVENKIVERSFKLDKEAKNAQLSYYLRCTSNDRDRLRISLNDKELFYSYPKCSSFKTLVLAENDLIIGENVISFESESGDFKITDARVDLELGTKKGLTYSFNLDREKYNDVFRKRADVVFEMEFDDEADFDLVVNGAIIHVRDDSGKYIRSLSRFVGEGVNVLRVEPLKTFKINSLVIRVE